MPDSVEAMERKWKCEESLQPNLRKHRPAGEHGRKACRLEVLAQQRSDEASSAEEVEGAGEGGTGDAG
jgi:hypothetical protein